MLYHPWKDNVEVDTLKILSIGTIGHVDEKRNELEKNVLQFARLGVGLLYIKDGGVMVQSRSESSVVEEVKENHDSDHVILRLKGVVH